VLMLDSCHDTLALVCLPDLLDMLSAYSCADSGIFKSVPGIDDVSGGRLGKVHAIQCISSSNSTK
jgi:hypothetical protein